ncbi:MAG TPA: WecB/TagA/CpsF family glycosyltransferase [Acidiphilium sp.]
MSLTPFGLEFDRAGPDEALAFALTRDPEAPFGYVVTPNVDHLARLRKQPELMGCYRAASLRLLDSRLLWNLARLLRLDPPPVVTGADLLAALLPVLDARAARVTLIGLASDQASELGARFPRIVLAHHTPPPGFEHDPVAFARARDFVNDHPAEITVFAVGSPRQEMLAHAVKETGQARGIGLCVGVAPLFAIGAIRRAPCWIRRVGLEWLWRLVQEPRRLARRYLLAGPPALVAILTDGFRRR